MHNGLNMRYDIIIELKVVIIIYFKRLILLNNDIIYYLLYFIVYYSKHMRVALVFGGPLRGVN